MRPFESGLDLRECLTEIIDYAGLFPPAGLNVEDALNEYLELKSEGPYQTFFRRFVFPMVPESRRRKLLQQLQSLASSAADTSIDVPVSLLLPNVLNMTELVQSLREAKESLFDFQAAHQSAKKPAQVYSFGRRCPRVESVEFSCPEIVTLSGAERVGFESFLKDFFETSPKVPLYIEQNWQLLDQQIFETFAQLRQTYPLLFLKVRTGGLTSATVPSPKILAGIIEMSAQARVPFKCTAGLHSALFETSKRFGFEMHGFINILVAVAVAIKNEKSAEIERILTVADFESIHKALVECFGASYAAALCQARHHMHSFGCCSIKEPYESLLQHRLIAQELT